MAQSQKTDVIVVSPLGPPQFGQIFMKAASSGFAGASAMVVQVTTLMWMRTIMNYQYRHGGTMLESMRFLYNDGGRGLKGVLRFYRGYLPALLQGPLSRFGDTAANSGTLALLNSFELTQNLPVAAKTATASTAAGLFRIVLMPIDCVKTTLQVEGKEALRLLSTKVRTNGPHVLWAGSLASAGATMVGHFPWFYTYNVLDSTLSPPAQFLPWLNNVTAQKLTRSATMGFCASIISDTCSNSIRVIKTTKQTHKEAIGYVAAVKEVLAKDGVKGLFGRGLGTRYVTNGLNGLMFSVMWRLIQDRMASK